jgi:hypothetical protein
MAACTVAGTPTSAISGVTDVATAFAVSTRAAPPRTISSAKTIRSPATMAATSLIEGGDQQLTDQGGDVQIPSGASVIVCASCARVSAPIFRAG